MRHLSIRHSLLRYSLITALLRSLAPTPRPKIGPAAFVDAATVVPGLIVDARYAGSHNFVGRPIDGYEAPRCLLTRPAAEALAGVAQRRRALRSRDQGVRLLSAGARGGEFHPLGARSQRYRGEGRVLSRRRQAHAVPRRLYIAALRPFARLDHRSDAGAPRRPRARHGHAVRFLQPEVLDRSTAASASRRSPIAANCRQRCGTTAFAPTRRNGGTSRCRMSRSRTPISIFR